MVFNPKFTEFYHFSHLVDDDGNVDIDGDDDDDGDFGGGAGDELCLGDADAPEPIEPMGMEF